jgi:hypothetical protein
MEGLSLLLKQKYIEGNITGIKVSRVVKILHLFFADDVLIMTTRSPQEWTEINNLLKTFCNASGLQINWNKSSFHYANLQDQTLTLLKALLPHRFLHLSEGINYIGFFLKAETLKPIDWNWLLAKVENRISHWCNHWLTLGGCYTLLKGVLEGHPVFWMALAAIPSSVLNKLRKISFNFLWSGCSDQHRQHLCN